MKHNFFQTQKREHGPSSLFGQLCLVPATNLGSHRVNGLYKLQSSKSWKRKENVGGKGSFWKINSMEKTAKTTLPGL